MTKFVNIKMTPSMNPKFKRLSISHSHKHEIHTNVTFRFDTYIYIQALCPLLPVLFILLFAAVFGHGADGTLNGLVLGVHSGEVL